MIVVDESVVSGWIQRYLSLNYRHFGVDEVAVTEACSPCLRMPYLLRRRSVRPTPSEFLKVVGQEVHVALQEVLRAEGWDVEVSVALPVGGFVLRGRIDALKDDTILEFKTVGGLPANAPHRHHQLQVQAYLTMAHASKGYIIYLSRTDGKVRVCGVSPKKDALKHVVERAKQLHQALKDDRCPPPARGPWCRYCPFTSRCGGRELGTGDSERKTLRGGDGLGS